MISIDDIDEDEFRDVACDKAVDRLAYVRSRIRRYQNEAAALKIKILSGEVSRVGQFHVARIDRHVVLTEIDDEL